MRNPVTPTMCSGVLVAAQRRAMLPVFGGISGSTSATVIIVSVVNGQCPRSVALSADCGQLTTGKDKKKRRASLEGLVVSFARPRRPQKFLCAGGSYVL